MDEWQDGEGLDALRKLHDRHPVARAVMDFLAGRVEEGSTTEVDDLEEQLKEEGFQVERGDIIDAFKSFADTGLGEFVVGRRGHPTRFEWKRDLAPALGTAHEAAKERIVRHRYRLRPDYEVKLELPIDLTSTEATRLADFVKTLPFE